MKLIYLDNSATTPTDLKVLKVMEDYFTTKFGNASEPHFLGTQAYEALQKSRQQIAQFLNADPREIIFTANATESINLAHKGLIEVMHRKLNKRLHIITTAVEHKAVIETCKHLQDLGLAEVTYLPVDANCRVNAEDVEKAIRPETVLVSVMYVNNEVGTVEPIEEIGSLLKRINSKRKKNELTPIYFHTDATQAIQYLDCNVDKLGLDMLSFTGHKIYAPKGIGVLYLRQKTPVARQMDGGKQESGFRAGTENIPYIAGLGKAVELASRLRMKESERLQKLRDYLIEGVKKIEGSRLTGHSSIRAPHVASFLIDGAEGESIMLLLSNKGIVCSTGSACNSSELQPSHVLSAMGVKPEDAHGSLRISLGRATTKEDIDYVLKELPKVVERLRSMAPKL